MKLNWADKPCVLIGGGPSLSQEQIDYAIRSGCYIMAINNGYQICPQADALYACDKKWWNHYKPDYGGAKYSLEYGSNEVCKLKQTGIYGIDFEWPGIRTGQNSGYQAINLAIHFGCTRLILIGYDMQHTQNKKHWHPDHPKPLSNAEPVKSFLANYNQVAPVLKYHGIEVTNCSIESALKCFPRARIEDVL